MSTTILITEDNEDTCSLLRFLLERQGYAVASATDGRAALEWIDANEPPALALLDVMLPHMSGLQLVTNLRSRPEWQDVPIVMLTAKSDEGDIVRALEAGANDYICKPFQPRELMARLKRFVQPA